MVSTEMSAVFRLEIAIVALKKQQFVQVLGCQYRSDKKKLTCFGKIRLIPPVAQIAQSVEQRIENPRVGGSIPPLGTIILWCVDFPSLSVHYSVYFIKQRRFSSVGRATDL